jgi:hypothetical protein
VPWTIGIVRKLLIFLAVLAVLVVGIDIGGRAFAESKVGESIAVKTGTTAPSVSIHGFSFLVQVISGHYSNITLTSTDLVAGPISGINATVELYNVDFPLGDAVKGDTSRLVAGTATLRSDIPVARITDAMTQTGAKISAGPNGAIRVSTTVSVSGQQIPVSADLVSSFAGGVLRLVATDVTAAGITLPNVAQLTKNLSLALPLKALPFTVQAATLKAAGASLILTATANNVRVGATS